MPSDRLLRTLHLRLGPELLQCEDRPTAFARRPSKKSDLFRNHGRHSPDPALLPVPGRNDFAHDALDRSRAAFDDAALPIGLSGGSFA